MGCFPFYCFELGLKLALLIKFRGSDTASFIEKNWWLPLLLTCFFEFPCGEVQANLIENERGERREEKAEERERDKNQRTQAEPTSRR